MHDELRKRESFDRLCGSHCSGLQLLRKECRLHVDVRYEVNPPMRTAAAKHGIP